MRRPLIVIFLLVLLCACGNREKYARLLAEADSLNQNYIPFTTDSTMKEVVDYYDHHGTANERMRAHYLLGCVYRDLGEAPHALECYHDAVDCADTTARDCDYKQLSRVYSQMAYIYDQEYVPVYQLSSLESACKYANLAKDTVLALIYQSKKADAYEKLGELDSATTIGRDIFVQFQSLGNKEQAARVLGLLIYIELKKEYSQVRKDMCYYEQESGFLPKWRSDFWKKLYYYLKGRYYLGVQKLDSAEIFFKKLLHQCENLNELHAAYDGLVQIYTLKPPPDSLSKYAVLSTKYNDSMHLAMHTENLQQIQAAYDYSRHQRLAEQKDKEASNARLWLLASGILFVVVLAVLFFYYQRIRYRHRMQVSNLNKKYATDLLLYSRMRKELTLLCQQRESYKEEILQHKMEIEKLSNRLAGYHENQGMSDAWDWEADLLDSPVVNYFHELASCGKKATADDWQQLRQYVRQHLPGFLHQLGAFPYKPTLRETQVCIMVRLRFIPTEMSTLLGVSPQVITNVRTRLLRKLFHVEHGSTTLFDQKIQQIEK